MIDPELSDAENFVNLFLSGVPLARARKAAHWVDSDHFNHHNGRLYVVYIFRDGSRAGYRRGNGQVASQAWLITTNR